MAKKKQGGRMSTTTKFGEHNSSIAANLQRLPADVQARYNANRKAYREDCEALEEWYQQGFRAGWEREMDD